MRILTLTDHAHGETRTGGIAARIGRRLARWHELSRQRRHLARLDERTLRDIGVSHDDARQGSRRWFWDDSLA